MWEAPPPLDVLMMPGALFAPDAVVRQEYIDLYNLIIDNSATFTRFH